MFKRIYALGAVSAALAFSGLSVAKATEVYPAPTFAVKYDSASTPAAIRINEMVRRQIAGHPVATGCYLIDVKTGLCSVEYVEGSENGGSGGSSGN